jgi:two-component system, cell cycle sensor histidine kinase and response regulator CckA
VPPDEQPHAMPHKNIEERTLRVLLEQLPALVWTTDADLRVTATAGEFARYEELTPVGETLYDRWGPDDAIGAIASHERALMGESVEHEGAISGRIFVSHLEPLRDDAGAIVGVVGVGVDQTERRRMQAELQLAERKYRTLVEQLPLAVYITDADDWNRVAFVSSYIEKMLGYTPEELTSDPELLRRIVHPDDLERAGEAARRLRETGEPLSEEYRELTRDGRLVHVLDETVPVRDEEGRILHYQGVLLDVTEHRVLEEQLRQSQKMEAIGRLAGGIAHDFNNLLTAIKGYGEFLLADLPEQTAAHHDAQEIVLAADRAATLTRQLLAFSRRQTRTPEPIGLNAVVGELEGLLRRLIGEQVEFVTELSPELPSVTADRVQLEQVILNLSVNARDAMPEGGRLCVATGLEDGLAVLRVSDTGVGMGPEVRSHIFEPFFTTKEPGKGTGLGLATVYGIVEQSGGAIDVQSAPGEGSTFTVRLPALDESVAVVAEAPAEAGSAGRVLLVEDEDLVRALVREVLERGGFSVLEAAGPAEAIEHCRSDEEIDLLVTDLVLPGMSGTALVERIASERPGLRVLYTSGYVDESLEATANVLEKPFTPDDLLRKVNALVGAVPD